MSDLDLLSAIPPTQPRATLLWSAIVDVGAPVDLGPAPTGHRYMVPILGGAFYPGPEHPELKGKVLPGSADRQLLRPDGVKELDAHYEMQTDDGTILTVHNQVIVDAQREGARYAMSVVKATAPEGPFDWLNRRLLIGTLQVARPARQAVIVRVWQADI